MDRRERMGDMTLLLQGAMDGQQAGIWTALPATYQGAGTKIGTANCQPTVQVRFLLQNGTDWGPWENLPVCPDCPISWPGGKRGRLVWPLVVGDEGTLVFASRSIDNWWLQGGTQPPGMIRMHDLSDGMFFPGVFSQPGAPGATTPPAHMRLTSDDGLTYVELDDVGQIVTVVAPGGIVLDGLVSFPDGLTVGGVPISGAGGVLAIAGGLTATTDITAGEGGADSVTLQNHTHKYIEPSTGGTPGAITGAPNAGT